MNTVFRDCIVISNQLCDINSILIILPKPQFFSCLNEIISLSLQGYSNTYNNVGKILGITLDTPSFFLKIDILILLQKSWSVGI